MANISDRTSELTNRLRERKQSRIDAFQDAIPGMKAAEMANALSDNQLQSTLLRIQASVRGFNLNAQEHAGDFNSGVNNGLTPLVTELG